MRAMTPYCEAIVHRIMTKTSSAAGRAGQRRIFLRCRRDKVNAAGHDPQNVQPGQ